jgi:serine/threonine-protein kinase
MADPLIPETLAEGRFRLLEVIGEGGMASVWRAFDQRLQRPRAIKILSPDLACRPALRRRFLAEAQTMANLEESRVVRIFDMGEDNDLVYIVMELIEGGSLLDRVRDFGPLPPRMAAEATVQICESLQAAHDAGVIHRDIKPHNILLTKAGEIRVTDFGIAQVQSDGAEGMTRTGAVMGTWGFMAPEQKSNAKMVDARADIYSMGATLWSLLTGETPPELFMADAEPGMMDAIPEELSEVIKRATRYRREDRYVSARAMAESLRALITLLPPDPDTAIPLAPAREEKRRKPMDTMEQFASEASPGPDVHQATMVPNLADIASFDAASLDALPAADTTGPRPGKNTPDTPAPSTDATARAARGGTGPVGSPLPAPRPGDSAPFSRDNGLRAEPVLTDTSARRPPVAEPPRPPPQPTSANALVGPLLGAAVGLGFAAVLGVVGLIVWRPWEQPEKVDSPVVVANPGTPAAGASADATAPQPTPSAPPAVPAAGDNPTTPAAPTTPVASGRDPAVGTPPSGGPAAGAGTPGGDPGRVPSQNDPGATTPAPAPDAAATDATADAATPTDPAPPPTPSSRTPTLTHSPPTPVAAGGTLSFAAKLPGSGWTVKLYYRPASGGAFQDKAMNGSGTYTAAVKVNEDLASGVLYFISATKGDTTLKEGSATAPLRVAAAP